MKVERCFLASAIKEHEEWCASFEMLLLGVQVEDSYSKV